MYRLFAWCKDGDIWYLGKFGKDYDKIRNMLKDILNLSDNDNIEFREIYTDILIDLISDGNTITVGHLALID